MSYIQDIAKNAIEGYTNPLQAYITLKRTEIELNEALAKVKNLAIDEALKHPEKTFKAFDATIEKKNAPGRWDYSEVGEWLKAKERVKQIETIAQVGGMDESGNEIQKAFKVEGSQTISISFK